MLYDGLGYFAVLTASNILNIILYQTSNPALQSSGASLGFAVVWIMSQRILIHLREVVAESNKPTSVVIARNTHSSHDVARAVRSQPDSKSPIRSNADVELAVQVHVEHTLSVDSESLDHDRDSDHHKPSFALGFQS